MRHYGNKDTCATDRAGATARRRTSAVGGRRDDRRDGVSSGSTADRRRTSATARKDFGEARLVWRCDDCGELGSLTAFPSACPDCGAGREALFYFTED